MIPNGVDARFAPPSADAVSAVRQKFQLPGPYVLSLGSIEPRKNLSTLLAAWPRVADRRPELTLALAGAANKIYGHIGVDPATLPRVKLLGYVDDADLPALYGAAEAFVFPSVYEGFGLPPLEAMACGTAVVCSDATALPEVVGDAALLTDPRDADAIADAVVTVTDDPALRRSLADRGRARAAKFSWDSSTDLVWQSLSRAATMN